MIDRIRRERIVSIRAAGDSDYLNLLVEELSPEKRVGAHQELARLAWAFDRLSARCREVMWLRRVKELSQKEVAERLGLAEKTVEKHLAAATRKLANYMYKDPLVSGRLVSGPLGSEKMRRNDEAEHDEARRGYGTHGKD